MFAYVMLLLAALAVGAAALCAVTADPLRDREAAKFRRLKNKWREETRYFSDPGRICGHSAYRGIIAMGKGALPLILIELKYGGSGHWHEALRAITGEDPVAEGNAGDLEAVRVAWLDWGRQNGYDI